MKRMIKAASNDEVNQYFVDAIDKAEDNFDYLVDGLNRLQRDGKDRDESVVQVIVDLNTQLDALTSRVADIISEEVGEE